MILSVSRRTDIPNYFSDWFFNRLREGYLYVRNPFNAHQISKINLSPEITDCIVFWSKNPANMMDRLDELKEYHYYFQFTLTGYGRDVEPNLPDKRKVLIPAFQKLSEKIGKERVVWRYDPILLNDRYSISYHLKAFREIAKELSDFTELAVISFVDIYAKTGRNTKNLHLHSITEDEIIIIAKEMAEIADQYGLAVETCAEKTDLQEYGIRHGCCIDKRRIEQMTGCTLNVKKDRTQRPECGCMASIDAGSYNTCFNGCRYCYANFNDAMVQENRKLYDPNALLLCGTVSPKDKITERKVESLKNHPLI